MKNMVPIFGFEFPIRPMHLKLNEDAPVRLPISGTFDRLEIEEIAAGFVLASQSHGTWMGCVHEARIEPDTHLAEMVQRGYVIEGKVSRGWRYHLSPIAISIIHFHQAEAEIKSLQKELESQKSKTLWERFCQKIMAIWDKEWNGLPASE